MSLFLKKVYGYFFQFNWNTLDQICFENFSNHLNERKLFIFLIKSENVHPEVLILLQINNEIISHLETRAVMIIWAIPADRPIGHNIDEILSNQSMVTEETIVRKSKQFTGFQPVHKKNLYYFKYKDKENWNEWKYTSYWNYWIFTCN